MEKIEEATFYTLQDMAQILKIPVPTLRHWLRKGLFFPAARTYMKRIMLFDRLDLEIVSQIKEKRSRGVILEDVLRVLRDGGLYV